MRRRNGGTHLEGSGQGENKSFHTPLSDDTACAGRARVKIQMGSVQMGSGMNISLVAL